jgi:hypothetical protein
MVLTTPKSSAARLGVVNSMTHLKSQWHAMHMKTKQRLIRSTLQAIVLFGFFEVGGAWGQGSTPSFKIFSTTSGCELSLEVKGFNERKYAWTGECRDGKVWGRGVLTYETNYGYGKGWEANWAEVGQFNNEGRKFGNWMLVNKGFKLIGYGTFQNGVETGRRFLSQAKKPETLDGARQYLDEWTNGRTDALVPFLWVATKTYFEDRANFYKGDFAKNSYADSSNANANNPQTNSADDPKVFGRSARGG